ncbi:MAG TPA: MFS transporter [Candidatus Dormibacteraeota bacterium]|nr:MFS transporter [Candidatus Dormibacteraeota bacterium]
MRGGPVTDVAVADQDGRRTLVPSARMAAAGAVAVEPDGEASVRWFEDGEGRRLDLRSTIREHLAALRPREVAAGGSLVPMVALMTWAFVNQADQSTFNLLGPEITNDLGIGLAALGGLISLTIVATAIVGPIYGFLVDRVKRVRLLRIGTMVSAFALFGTASATGPGALSASRVGMVVGTGMAQTTSVPLVTDYYPPAVRMRFFSLEASAGTLALVLAPLFAGLLATATSWRVPIAIVGAISLLSIALLMLLREPVRGAQDRRVAGAGEDVALQQQRPMSWGESWRAIMAIRTFRRVLLSWPFTLTGSNGVGAVLVSFWYADHWQLDSLQRAVVFSCVTAVMLPVLIASGPIADRLMRNRPGQVMVLLAMLQFANGLAVVGIILSPWLPLAIALHVFIAVASALIGPMLFGVTTLVVPPRIRGFGVSLYSVSLLVGAVVIPAILGVAQSSGYLAGALLALPFLGLCSALFLSAAGTIGPDIRAMLAASMADAESRRAREEGRSKLLVCRDVEVTYDGSQVLRSLDFDLRDGEMVALLGTNGAGKSTLLRAVTGIQHVSNGAVFLDGDDVTHVPPNEIAERGVVMMPGGRAVFPTLSVAENLDAAEWLYRRDPAEERAARRDEALRLFPRLTERMSTRAGDLSGGEQQMLALAQALIMRPRLLLIDELSLGLAPTVVANLLDVVRRIHAAGTTVVIVEQSVNVALQLAERAVFMENGEIRFDGSLAELSRRGDILRAVFLQEGGGSLARGQLRGVTLRDEEEQPALQVRGVRVSYGGLHALDGVDLEVMPGEVVGIVGPNGAGKTTLFDAITGFVDTAAGEILLDGVDVTALPPYQRARHALARSYQNVRLFSALTVRDTIAVALDRHLANRSALSAALWLPFTRRSERRAARRIDNLIATLHLEPYQNKFMSELSTGTRRVVDIACQLAASPKLLLLDEPSSGLAQAESEALATTIQRIRKETGCGILVIEHDLALITQVSDRLVAMELGRTVRQGTPAEVLADPHVKAALLGAGGAAVAARSGRGDVDLVGAAATERRDG